jgi:hypothetical protein
MNSSWKAYPLPTLNKLLGFDSFKCTLDTTKDMKINTFYWAILKNLTILNDKNKNEMTVLDIRVIFINRRNK